MARLRFEECKNCVDWNGNRAHCMDICSKPLLAWDEFNRYKDAEEQGLLIHLPCKYVYYIIDKNTKYATVMMKSIDDLSIYEIKKIDKDGRYFSTEAKANQALQALKEGVKNGL